MKFNKAIIEEGIEIINQGMINDKIKAFTIDGDGPYSIFDLSKSSDIKSIKAYKILNDPKIRKIIANNIKLLKINDPKIQDISFKASGEIVITSDNGKEIVRLKTSDDGKEIVRSNTYHK